MLLLLLDFVLAACPAERPLGGRCLMPATAVSAAPSSKPAAFAVTLANGSPRGHSCHNAFAFCYIAFKSEKSSCLSRMRSLLGRRRRKAAMKKEEVSSPRGHHSSIAASSCEGF
jgi:hypothetical protein